MKINVMNVLKKYGSVVKITEDGNTIFAKGFIYPLYHKNKGYYDIKMEAIGKVDNGHCLLITQPDVILNKCGQALVESGKDKYITKLNGTYVVDDKKIYVWAVLTAYTAPVEDDYDDH